MLRIQQRLNLRVFLSCVKLGHGFMKNAPDHFLSEEYFIFHEFLIMVFVFNEY